MGSRTYDTRAIRATTVPGPFGRTPPFRPGPGQVPGTQIGRSRVGCRAASPGSKMSTSASNADVNWNLYEASILSVLEIQKIEVCRKSDRRLKQCNSEEKFPEAVFLEHLLPIPNPTVMMHAHQTSNVEYLKF